jgi:hypothetical protein
MSPLSPRPCPLGHIPSVTGTWGSVPSRAAPGGTLQVCLGFVLARKKVRCVPAWASCWHERRFDACRPGPRAGTWRRMWFELPSCRQVCLGFVAPPTASVRAARWAAGGYLAAFLVAFNRASAREGLSPAHGVVVFQVGPPPHVPHTSLTRPSHVPGTSAHVPIFPHTYPTRTPTRRPHVPRTSPHTSLTRPLPSPTSPDTSPHLPAHDPGSSWA